MSNTNTNTNTHKNDHTNTPGVTPKLAPRASDGQIVSPMDGTEEPQLRPQVDQNGDEEGDLTSQGSMSTFGVPESESGRGRRASQLRLSRSGLGMAPRRERSVLVEPTWHSYCFVFRIFGTNSADTVHMSHVPGVIATNSIPIARWR
jgi:hypothetical protein